MLKLQVTNIDRALGENELRRLFEKFGKVSECTLVMDKVTGKSKGFGFVIFEDPFAANNAAEKLNGRPVNGQSIKVKAVDSK